IPLLTRPRSQPSYSPTATILIMGGCASKPKDNDGTSPEDIPVVPDVTPTAVSVTEAPEIQAPGGSNDDAKEENKKEAEAAVSEAKAEG
ncbi:unnamed protein product, partial [Musa textilis]